MNEFKPFENCSQVITAGRGNGITIENGKDVIVIYGDTEIHKGDSVEGISLLIDGLTKIRDEMLIVKNKIKISK